MKLKTMLFFLMLSTVIVAQTKSTKETKVIAVVTNNTIAAIEHFETYRTNEEALVKKYPKSKFFIGLLKGKYEVNKNIITPQNEATITIYTDKQIFQKSGMFSNKKPALGDQLTIGKTKAKVIASKKGELIIKTN